MVLSFSPAGITSWGCGSGRGEEPSGGRSPPPDSDPFSDVKFAKNLVKSSRQFAGSCESPLHLRGTQSAFHPRTQRNAFCRRGARQQLVQFTIKTNLKQSEEFEDNHDNDNYSDYVEDASVHARVISGRVSGSQHLSKLTRRAKAVLGDEVGLSSSNRLLQPLT
jgi:hypothetical protein